MKRLQVGLACLLLSAFAFGADGSSYSLDLNLSPANLSGSYLCKAEIKDLDTGKVVSAPSITLVAGTPAATKTSSGDQLVELKVSVDPKGSRATAELKVSRAGKVVAAQTTSLTIR
jgi:hypothetical protein